jgi:hypothetical protein
VKLFMLELFFERAYNNPFRATSNKTEKKYSKLKLSLSQFTLAINFFMTHVNECISNEF